MEQLDGHFDNMEVASTNSHAAIDQISSATTEQYAKIKSSLENLAAAPPSKPSPISTPNNTNLLSSTESA